MKPIAFVPRPVDPQSRAERPLVRRWMGWLTGIGMAMARLVSNVGHRGDDGVETAPDVRVRAWNLLARALRLLRLLEIRLNAQARAAMAGAAPAARLADGPEALPGREPRAPKHGGPGPSKGIRGLPTDVVVGSIYASLHEAAMLLRDGGALRQLEAFIEETTQMEALADEGAATPGDAARVPAPDTG